MNHITSSAIFITSIFLSNLVSADVYTTSCMELRDNQRKDVAIIGHYAMRDPFTQGRLVGACESTGAKEVLVLSDWLSIPCDMVMEKRGEIDASQMWRMDYTSPNNLDLIVPFRLPR